MTRKKLFYLPFAGIGLSVIGLAASCGTTEVANSGSQQTVKITEKAQKKAEFKGTKITGKTLGSAFSRPENSRRQKSKTSMDENGAVVGFTMKSGIFKTAKEQTGWIKKNLSGINALVVDGVDDSVVGGWSATWKDATHPVVAYNKLIHSTDRNAYNWYVTFDNAGIGQLQAKAILANLYEDKTFLTKTQAEIEAAVVAKKLEERKIVVALGGDPGDKNARLLYDGAMDIIKAVAAKDSNLVVPEAFNTFQKVAQVKWSYKESIKFLDAKLKALNKNDRKAVAAVVSPNDEIAGAAINVLKANGINPKTTYITGQDADDTAIKSIFLETGQDMTIIKSVNLATAVTTALVKEMLGDAANYNKAPGDIATDKRDALLAAIRNDFSVKFKYDGTSYETETGKPINALLLTPTLMNKDNLSTYYDVKKV